MKSLRRFYDPTQKTHQIPFPVFAFVVLGLVAILLPASFHRDFLIERNQTLEAAVLRLDDQAEMLEKGIKTCANGRSIIIFLDKEKKYYSEIDCKLIFSNVWGAKKKVKK